MNMQIKKAEYKQNVMELTGNKEVNSTVEDIFNLYTSRMTGSIIWDTAIEKTEVLTNSLEALEKTFDDVVYFGYKNGIYDKNVEGKVVFIHGNKKADFLGEPDCVIDMYALA